MDEKLVIDLDRETLEALTRRAEANGKSADQLATEIVRQEVGTAPASKVDFVAWSRRIRAMTPKAVKQTDSWLLLREDRDR